MWFPHHSPLLSLLLSLVTLVSALQGPSTLQDWQASGQLPLITDSQWEALEALRSRLLEWNAKVNLVSRKDVDMLVPSHIIPSLAVMKVRWFQNEDVIDVGTGGGFPGLPLAIVCPEARFTLLDSNGKKIMVVRDIAEHLGLRNVRTVYARAETVEDRFDFILGRAVSAVPTFLSFASHLIRADSKAEPTVVSGYEETVSSGLLYIKGGEFSPELREAKISGSKSFPIQGLLGGLLETDKSVLHIPSAEIAAFHKRHIMEQRRKNS